MTTTAIILLIHMCLTFSVTTRASDGEHLKRVPALVLPYLCDTNIKTITQPKALSSAERRHVIKEILVSEHQASAACLRELAARKLFYEAYDFLDRVFNYEPLLEEEYYELLDNIRVKNRPMAQIKSDINDLPDEIAPNLRWILKLLPQKITPEQSFLALSDSAQKRFTVCCDADSAKEAYRIIRGVGSYEDFAANLSAIVDDVVASVYDHLDDYFITLSHATRYAKTWPETKPRAKPSRLDGILKSSSLEFVKSYFQKSPRRRHSSAGIIER